MEVKEREKLVKIKTGEMSEVGEIERVGQGENQTRRLEGERKRETWKASVKLWKERQQQKREIECGRTWKGKEKEKAKNDRGKKARQRRRKTNI